jgi:non-canonical purine NTP pyrophosphatase (RdgB/HAM1 family)
MRFILASANRHKLSEFAGILAPHVVEPMPEGLELPPEGTESFLANAQGKARAVAAARSAAASARADGPKDADDASGSDAAKDADVPSGSDTAKGADDPGPVYVIADDSGLEVEALDWAPGVISSRFAGREGDDAANNAHLLSELEARGAAAPRRARFVCVLACVTPEGDEFSVRGEWPGTIATAPRGGHGFGYDPLVVPDGETRSVAELPDDEKNAASHRARAGRALIAALAARGALR